MLPAEPVPENATDAAVAASASAGRASPARRWRQYLLLLTILALAAGLRLYRIDSTSLWLDEFASVELAMGRGYARSDVPRNVILPNPPNLIHLDAARPIREVWFSEVKGHMPPLYQLLVRLWGEVFGLSAISVRSFSVAFSLLGIVLLYLCVAELSGAATALWAAAVMATAGAQIQFGQEARSYSLLTAEALAAALALVRIERRGPTLWREVALTLAVLALTVTHYFAAGTLIALAVYAGWRLSDRARRRVIACFVIAAAAWCVLGAPLAMRQRHNLHPAAAPFLQDDAPGSHIARTAARLAKLPVRFLTEPTTASLPVASVGAVSFLVAVLLPRRRPDLLLWGLWFVLTLLPLAALDLAKRTQHLEFVRYGLLAAPALYALTAGALAHRRPLLRHLPPAVVMISCLLALPAAYQAWWKADWRSFAYSIDRAKRPDDLTVFWADQGMDPGNAYLHTCYYRRSPAGPVALVQNPPDADLLRQIRQAPGLLLVTGSTGDAAARLQGARFQWCGAEAGCGTVWRVTWPEDRFLSPATTNASRKR